MSSDSVLLTVPTRPSAPLRTPPAAVRLSLSELGVSLADEPPVAVARAQLPAVLVDAQLHGPVRGAAEREVVCRQVLRQEGAERLQLGAVGVEAELALALQVGHADVGLRVGGAAQHQERLQVLLLGPAGRRHQRGAGAEQGGTRGARVRPRGGAERWQAQAHAAGVEHLLGTGALARLARARCRVTEARVALRATLARCANAEVGHAPERQTGR